MTKSIKIEVLIATPPTNKCGETLAVLEELVRSHPDELRLVIFRRGIDFAPPEMQSGDFNPEDCLHKEASLQMRQLINKGSAVPVVVVDGVLFCSFVVPDPLELDTKIKGLLVSTSGN